MFEVRSTILYSSVRALDDRGYGERYRRLLPREHRDAVLDAAVWGEWLPLEVARAHYEACDRLDLAPAEMVDLGFGNERRREASFLSRMLRAAASRGGAWASLRTMPRLYTLFVRGGELRVRELGPRDARIDIVDFPLAHIRYVRLAARGLVTRGVALFADKTVGVEVPEGCTERALAYRVRWGDSRA
jgi:hypothetical protein